MFFFYVVHISKFTRADVDHDQKLSKDELLNYILKNVNQHIQEAKERNTQLFLLIDSNQDGKLKGLFTTYQTYTQRNLLLNLKNFSQ